MDMPKPLDEHKKLAALAGSWSGEETLFPSPWDPKGGKGTGRIEARLACDGFFLVTDYVEERGGQAVYRGHGVYGWDPGEKCYTMYWVDSIGSPSSVCKQGRWNGNTLVFEQMSPMGRHRYTYTFEGEGRYTFLIENSQDGKQWAPFMEGKYRRK